MSGITAKRRAMEKAIKDRAGAKCTPRIVVGKHGARECTSCGAKASTAKIIMLCARTGRLPGAKA